MSQSFSHRQARSMPLVATLAFLVAVETVIVHFLLFRYSLILAVVVSLLGLSGFVWLVADYRALGTLTTTVTSECIILRVGRRATATIPRELLATAISPSWRDLPESASRAYLNLTKPAEPNVLLTFREPVVVHLPAGLRRPIRVLAVFIDTPDAFLAAVNSDKSLAGRTA